MGKQRSKPNVLQRGRDKAKRAERKAVIRDAFVNGPQKEVQIIPATQGVEVEGIKRKLRVCAYCRVSTGPLRMESGSSLRKRLKSSVAFTACTSKATRQAK